MHGELFLILSSRYTVSLTNVLAPRSYGRQLFPPFRLPYLSIFCLFHVSLLSQSGLSRLASISIAVE